MRKMFHFQKLSLLLLFISNSALAQISYTENRNLRSENSDLIARDVDLKNFTEISSTTDNTTYVNNSILSSNQQSTEGTNDTENISFNLQLNYDPQEYIAPWIIYVYNEEGYMNVAFYQGNDEISMNVPAGEYDVFAEFKHVSNRATYVVKEHMNISEGTVVDINPTESTNYISIKTVDQNGQPLNPGIHYPETNTYTQLIVERYFSFQPTQMGLGVSSYVTDYPVEETGPLWDFYINNVSDRYVAYHSSIGNKFETGNYLILFDKLTNFQESQEIINQASEYVYHEEKFQPSNFAQNNTKYYGFGTELVLNQDLLLGGWAIVNNQPISTETPIKTYINRFKNESEYGMMLYPQLAEHVAIIDPYYGPESFSIKGASVFGDPEGNVHYGSSHLSYSSITLANKYYLNMDGYVLGLPHHPKFTLGRELNSSAVLGSSVPITVTGTFLAPELTSNSLLINYKGQYNEIRETDVFATDVILKQNGQTLFDGTYLNFLAEELPEEGQVEIILTNENTKVGDILGNNTTELIYDASSGNEPPTLQMLQFRNGEEIVTNRFTSNDVPVVRIAAGDFDYVAMDDWSGEFQYVAGNNVTFFYREHNQSEWVEIPLTEMEEFFQLPAFGNYYEASLATIQPTSENAWYDVKVISTDADGNKQIQTISPAFQLNSTLNTQDLNAENDFVVYPNPFSDIVSFEIPENLNSNYKLILTDLSGKQILSQVRNAKDLKNINLSFLPKGIYLFSIEVDGKLTSKKLIKK